MLARRELENNLNIFNSAIILAIVICRMYAIFTFEGILIIYHYTE